MPYVQVKKDGDTLTVAWDSGIIFLGGGPLEATVAMPRLTKVEISGFTRASVSGFMSSESMSINLSSCFRPCVSLEGDIHVGNINISLFSDSRLTLRGSAEHMELDMREGRADLSKFSIGSATVAMSSSYSDPATSFATVNVKDSLGPISLTGHARLIYIGHPVIGDITQAGGPSFVGGPADPARDVQPFLQGSTLFGRDPAELRTDDRSIDDLNEAIRLDTNDALLLYNRGLAFYELGAYEQAADDLWEAIDLTLFANLRGTTKILASVCDARDVYRSAALASGEYEYVIGGLNNIMYLGRGRVGAPGCTIESLDSQRVGLFYGRGLAHYSAGSYQQAMSDIGQALGIDSELGKAYVLRAAVHSSMGHIEEARGDLSRAAELGVDLTVFKELTDEIQ